MPAVFERVKAILVNKYSVEPELITPEATIESLGLDSLDFIEMLFEVEDEFHIRVPQDGGGTALKATTLQDIVNSIDKLLAQEEPLKPAAEP